MDKVWVITDETPGTPEDAPDGTYSLVCVAATKEAAIRICEEEYGRSPTWYREDDWRDDYFEGEVDGHWFILTTEEVRS